eukprot:COSAG02_NODE_36014_length_460_cov_0.717452_1_plen_82_part_10
MDGWFERNDAAAASCEGLHCRSKERPCSASSGKFFAKVGSSGERKSLTVRGHVARSTVGVSPGWSGPSCEQQTDECQQREQP